MRNPIRLGLNKYSLSHNNQEEEVVQRQDRVQRKLSQVLLVMVGRRTLIRTIRFGRCRTRKFQLEMETSDQIHRHPRRVMTQHRRILILVTHRKDKATPTHHGLRIPQSRRCCCSGATTPPTAQQWRQQVATPTARQLPHRRIRRTTLQRRRRPPPPLVWSSTPASGSATAGKAPRRGAR